MPLRIASTLALIALATAAAAAGAAPLRTSGISSRIVHRGQRVVITATNTNLTPCKAVLQYSNGKITETRRYAVRNHRVRIPVRVAKDAALGPGTWRVTCLWQVAQGQLSVVAAAPKSVTAAPQIVVAKQGFSQKPSKYGTGSLLSYGLLLQNSSPTEDAENVYVIVNAVDASGGLVGSKAQTVALIPAGSTWGLGDSISLRSQVPVTQLELTVRVGAHEPKKAHPAPTFENVSIVPSILDPGYVGEVDGEIANDTTPLTLITARLSIVVLDKGGTPIGGGVGASTAPLPSGSRFVFAAQSGFTAIPLDQAATAIVSAEPRYAPAS